MRRLQLRGVPRTARTTLPPGRGASWRISPNTAGPSASAWHARAEGDGAFRGNAAALGPPGTPPSSGGDEIDCFHSWSEAMASWPPPCSRACRRPAQAARRGKSCAVNPTKSPIGCLSARLSAPGLLLDAGVPHGPGTASLRKAGAQPAAIVASTSSNCFVSAAQASAEHRGRCDPAVRHHRRPDRAGEIARGVLRPLSGSGSQRGACAAAGESRSTSTRRSRPEDAGEPGRHHRHPSLQDPILEHVDRVLPTGKRSAPSTRLRREPDGSWLGDMFDGKGLVGGHARERCRAARKTRQLLGAGGAGSAIADALADAGARSITLFDQDLRRPASSPSAYAMRIRLAIAAFGDPSLDGRTCLSMPRRSECRPRDGLPADFRSFAPALFVVDIVPRSDETALLAKARAAGCRTMAGPAMVAGQVDEMLRFFGIGSS